MPAAEGTHQFRPFEYRGRIRLVDSDGKFHVFRADLSVVGVFDEYPQANAAMKLDYQQEVAAQAAERVAATKQEVKAAMTAEPAAEECCDEDLSNVIQDEPPAEPAAEEVAEVAVEDEEAVDDPTDVVEDAK